MSFLSHDRSNWCGRRTDQILLSLFLPKDDHARGGDASRRRRRRRRRRRPWRHHRRRGLDVNDARSARGAEREGRGGALAVNATHVRNPRVEENAEKEAPAASGENAPHDFRALFRLF